MNKLNKLHESVCKEGLNKVDPNKIKVGDDYLTAIHGAPRVQIKKIISKDEVMVQYNGSHIIIKMRTAFLRESLSPIDALHESVCKEATKFKVGDKVRIDSGMGGTFTVKITKISGNTYSGVIDNKQSDFHNKKRTFTDKDIKSKESLSPIDTLHESVCKEEIAPDLLRDIKKIKPKNLKTIIGKLSRKYDEDDIYDACDSLFITKWESLSKLERSRECL